MEKILPSSVVVVREMPERAREVTTVKVAEELDVAPHRLQPYLRVEVGGHVEREQRLAAIVKPGVMRLAKSPVRGRIAQIDLQAGTMQIEPLLEEKEVRAWLPGTVQEVDDRGRVATAEGVTVRGVWGTGGEAWGPLVFERVETGKVAYALHAGPALLAAPRERKAAGVIAGGVNLQDVLQPNLGFTLVVLEGFGLHRVADQVQGIKQAHEGKIALVDGTTRHRVGVRRPVVILPD